MTISVSSLTLYPVKSCAGIPVNHFRCSLGGPEWDREWMIVGGDGGFVTQREIPRLALVRPHLDFDRKLLRLTATGHNGGVEIPLHFEGPSLEAVIWEQPVAAQDQGMESAKWLSDVFGLPLRLARIGQDNRHRTGVDPRTIRFADSYPLHLCSHSSVDDLNRRLPSPVGIERFRANITISGSAPWAEDDWTCVRLGASRFRIGRKAERCVITTVDQLTAQKGSEPLKTLAGFRRNARNKIEFGQYLHSAVGAEISVGMELFPE